MSLFISQRDPALADVSDEALRQLTKLLYVDTADYFGDRAGEWLAKQEQKVKKLDATLLRPRDLIARFAIGMSKRRLPFCPEGARLCPAHKALDPRVIRNMLLMVADECTIQTNRYRSLRLKKMLSPSLEGWMGRMDSVTALWLGEGKFRRVFGCGLRGGMPDCVKTKCEACMLAVIGGSALYLTDLRASVLARQAYNTKLTGREHRRPRLLRIVTSWISFYRADCRQAVCECSEAIVSDIVAMRTLARRRRDKEDERRRRKGKPPRSHGNSRVRLTEQGLPIPRQPRLREGDRERLARRVERRRAERASSLRGKLFERQAQQQEHELEAYRRHDVADEARDPLERRFAQENSDTTKTTTGSKSERGKQRDSWEDWPSDEEACGKEDGEEEYWVRDYRRLILEGHDGASSLNLGANTRLVADMASTTSSWTSKVDDEDDSDVESPRVVEVPLLYRGDEGLPQEGSSSLYSCDERDGGRETLDKALSMISGLMRDSAGPASLRFAKADLDVAKGEKERNANHRTALAMLEGREEEVASCYETMGWGGPRR